MPLIPDITAVQDPVLKAVKAGKVPDFIAPLRELVAAEPRLENYPHLAIALITAVRSSQKTFRLVLSDVDGTLLDPGANDLGQLTELRAKIDSRNDALILITGRYWDRADEYVKAEERGELTKFFSAFPAVVNTGGRAALGLSLQGKLLTDSHYAEYVRQIESAFREQAVLARVKEMLPAVEQKLALDLHECRIVSSVDPQALGAAIRLQPHVHGPGCELGKRVSLYFYARSLKERDEVLDIFAAEFPQHRVIVCESTGTSAALRERSPSPRTPLRYCMDIGAVDKSNGVDFFADTTASAFQKLGANSAKTPKVEVWFCGDAGNDLPAFRHPAVTHCCAVGGCTPELRREIPALRATGKAVYVEDHPERLMAQSIVHALGSL